MLLVAYSNKLNNVIGIYVQKKMHYWVDTIPSLWHLLGVLDCTPLSKGPAAII